MRVQMSRRRIRIRIMAMVAIRKDIQMSTKSGNRDTNLNKVMVHPVVRIKRVNMRVIRTRMMKMIHGQMLRKLKRK
jgi:hypothetical protein